MSSELINSKFETFELLKPSKRHPKGKPFAVIPHFFFNMWLKFSPYIDHSFWITLFFLLRDTLGKSSVGTTGKVAQSQFPVDPAIARKWLNVLAEYGGLVEVVKAGYRDHKGSEYTLNPSATEVDWLTFLYMISRAQQEGLIGTKATVDEIRKLFAYRKSEPKRNNWPFYSLNLLMMMADEDCEWYREAKKVDCANPEHWIARGFPMRPFLAACGQAADGEPPKGLIEDFVALEHADWDQLMRLFHWAWVKTELEDDVPPVIPENVEALDRVVQNIGGDLIFPGGAVSFTVLALFRQADYQLEGGPWLENEWLTDLWRKAKKKAELDGWLKKNADKQVWPDMKVWDGVKRD